MRSAGFLPGARIVPRSMAASMRVPGAGERSVTSRATSVRKTGATRAAISEVQKTPAFASPRVGTLAGDLVFPLAAGERRAARHPGRLDGLYVMPVLPPYPQHRALAGQRVVLGIEVRADELRALGARARRHVLQHAPHSREIDVPGSQLYFDLGRDSGLRGSEGAISGRMPCSEALGKGVPRYPTGADHLSGMRFQARRSRMARASRRALSLSEGKPVSLALRPKFCA